MKHIVVPAGKSGISSSTVIAIATPIAASIMLFIAGSCLLRRRGKKKRKVVEVENGNYAKPILLSNYLLARVYFCTFCNSFTSLNNLLFGCVADDEITIIESLQFDFGTIEAGTSKFSTGNKLGEGGFGEVYKV